MRGDLDAARDLYDASIALNRELGNEAMIGVEMTNKSWVEINTGRLDEAEELVRGSLELTVDEDAYGLAFCLLSLARVHLERGDVSGAEMLGAAEGVLEAAELVWDPAEQPEYERTLGVARDLVGSRLASAGASSKAIGIPSGAQSRYGRKPQK
jgi:hypothetical protein